MAGYEAWLRGLGRDGLAELIRRRLDVLHQPRPPGSVHALASLLLLPHSVYRALAGLDELTLGVASAMVMLGSTVHRDQLADLLGEPEHVATEDVDDALRQLQDLAVVWSAEPDVWNVTGGLTGVIGTPFGLGPPLHRMLADLREADLRALARGVGVDAGGPVKALRAHVEARLSDPDHVRTTAAGGPAQAAAVLHSLTWADSAAGLAASFAPVAGGLDPDDEKFWGFEAPGEEGPWDDDPRAAQHLLQDYEQVVSWLHRTGMLLRAGWEEHMPREVALALRGPDWRPALQRQPPVVEVAANERGVRSDGAAAASALLRDAVRLLGVVDERPAAQLRSDSGGIGVREVKRLAREVGTQPRRVELLLALLAALGLLQRGHASVGTTAQAQAWRDRDPARQLVDLLTQWWSCEEGITYRPDHRTGKPIPVLGWGVHPAGQRNLRHAVVGAVSALPPGRGTTGPDGVQAAVEWRGPLVVPPSPELEEVLGVVWWEAEAVGALGAGAATPTGRALAGADETALLEEATAVLPAVTRSAVLQSDLTALVHGVASATLTDLLNSCADLEDTGGSTRWRFCEASVRRALDAGATADDLVSRLADVAEHDIPQPLAYLVKDVGRRHGTIRVVALSSAVVCTDETLLTEVLHTRQLSSLGLRRLAGPVLASAKPAEETTTLLRRHGFMPVQEDDQGRVVVTGRRRDDEPAPEQALHAGLGPGMAVWGRSVREAADARARDAAARVAATLLGT